MGNVSAVRGLLHSGLPLNWPDYTTGETMLDCAVKCDRVRMVVYLVEQGELMTARHARGLCPMHMDFFKKRSLEIVIVLNEDGWIPSLDDVYHEYITVGRCRHSQLTSRGQFWKCVLLGLVECPGQRPVAALMRLLQFRYAAQVLADVTEAIMVLLERTSTAPRNKAVVRIFQNLYACKRRASAARLSWMYGCLGK
jgi:hypothetical protein